MRGLTGQRIVIAGGGNGIGAGTAERLAAEGATVVIGDIDVDAAQATAKRISDVGGAALAVESDLADERSVRALFDTTVDQLGGVDGLYNVAADASADVLGRDGDLLDMDPAVWRRTLEVNLIGFALTCRAALPLLLAKGGGAIVNTSSASAHVGDHQRAAYQTSKAGINALTRHVASRWGKEGIRCNCVSPGVVMTESAEKMALTPQALEFARMTIPSPRFGRPGDLAGVVAFLLSDDAEWINGQVWSINGGALLRE
ncbi:SDR family NAD(P)-dependent oxidoreductase [Streptomyces sp. AK08-02]|uniref:SDR family NAD(P)-dependent oxidoreductase n=1 Tax=Streptomyces sp. AK08-02 TaxID=3028654 RepID=UPI0029BAFE8F|nr:SDR family NAD(P)-dependent oxidoreductase [Streptomyces sp. AK08-02]MDX3746548.1 SDR family NAD(P)-dependent oxidoreductase [Streptomyces sp. AK08-02]